MTPRLYVPHLVAALRDAPQIRLDAQASHHLVTVLRIGIGDIVELFDGVGNYQKATISITDKRQACVLATGPMGTFPAPALGLHLVQGLALGDKMDWIIEKAVELGVSRITPWRAQRSQLKLDGERATKRLAHWRAIIRSACEQSGQYWLPQLDDVSSLSTVLSMPAQMRVFGAVGTGAQPATSLRQLAPKITGQCTLIVGPESGLSPDETAMLEAAQAIGISLGPRILRTETAGLAAIAALQCWVGDWSNLPNQVQ